MEGKFQTSFIPKKPLTASAQRLSSGISLVSLIAGLMVAASLALAGAVFLYESYLVRDINSKKESFKANQDAFNPNTVTTFSTLNRRINVAETLMKKHIAPSSIFSVLDQFTLRNIRFTDFTYLYVNEKKITLNMSGQSPNSNYNAVAKQSDVFSENPASQFIHEPIFSDLDVDQKGNVVFSFAAEIDPQQILYSNHIPAPDAPEIVEELPAVETNE